MTHNFSNVNTSISVREKSFLSSEQWQQLLSAKDNQAVSLILQGTPYQLTSEQLNQPDKIEEVLMRALKKEYDFLFEESPQTAVIELFSAQYLYHNLKVLMKMRATKRELSSLLIPIGKFSLDTLRYLISTLESSVVYPQVVEEVRRTWTEYEAYQLTDAIDVGFDGAYFAHLRLLEEKIDNPAVAPIVNAMIDFYNAIAIKRAFELDKSRSFMKTMTTSRGSISKDELINHIAEGRLAQWFENQTDLYFGDVFQPYLTAMNEQTISATQLERLSDAYIHQYLYQHRLDTEGPLPVMRYLFGKEMEVKNLRLVLIGRFNGLTKEQITERMGAIYGERI